MRKVQKISKTPAKLISTNLEPIAKKKKAQQVNPSPFKSAQVPWTYFFFFWIDIVTETKMNKKAARLCKESAIIG